MRTVGKLGAGAAIAGAVAALRARRGPRDEPAAAIAPAPTDAPEPVTAPMEAEAEAEEDVASAEDGDDDVGIDLNEADFDQLRGLNLSVTLSHRIIAARNANGGFSSLEDLDGIRGLSVSTRADLRRRFRV